MIRLHHNKALGLALGEKSLLAAEVVGGVQPRITRMAEFAYGETDFAAQGPALAKFLRGHGFSSRNAVVGLPAAWLLFKTKEVPPVDGSELASLLRIQAENDFPSDLKDMLFDYAAPGYVGTGKTSRELQLLATPRRYVEGAAALCDGAGLNCAAVTASAFVLGAATQRSRVKSAMVLAVGPCGAELTAQGGPVANAVRRLRGQDNLPLFVSELRRAVLTLPHNGADGGLVVWDGLGLDAAALGQSLNLSVRRGELSDLGVALAAGPGEERPSQYAAAVALALAGTGNSDLPQDFLHSPLAPPRQRRLRRRTLAAAVVVVLLGLGALTGWIHQNSLERQVDADTAQFNRQTKPQSDEADAFVRMVLFAQRWHEHDARYAACLRDITQAIPEDGRTYVSSIEILETELPVGGGPAAGAAPNARNIATVRMLTGTIKGTVPTQSVALNISDQMKQSNFVEVGQFNTVPVGRTGEVTFTISFQYGLPLGKS